MKGNGLPDTEIVRESLQEMGGIILYRDNLANGEHLSRSVKGIRVRVAVKNFE